MINTTKLSILYTSLSLLVASVTDAAIRNVTVSVTVLLPNGSPVEGIGIRGFTTEGAVAGLTNASGVATIEAKVADSSEQVRVAVWPVVPEIRKPGAERKAIIEKYIEIAETNFYATEYVVATPAPATTFNLSISGLPAITVSGRAVSSTTPAEPVRVMVQPIGGCNPITQMLDYNLVTAEFEIKSVPQSRKSFVILSTAGCSELKVIRIGTTQSASNLSLGDVVMPDPLLGKSVDIQVSNRNHPFLDAHKEKADFLTAMSVDGQRLYMFKVKASGEVIAGIGGPPVPKMMSGSYYLIPGSANSEPSIRTIYAIENGVNMAPANLPVLIVPASGDATPIVIDAAQVLNSVNTHLPAAP